MMRKIGLIGMVLSVAACQTPMAPPAAPAPVLPARIDGIARYHTPDGRGVSCSGLSIILVADTQKARGRMLALYGSLDHAVELAAVVKSRSAGLAPPDPPIGAAQCDAVGAFAIPSVQPGSYYLIAHVRPAVAARPSDDQVILQRVVVRSGETRQVRLAP